jgi:hypothetical protein
MDSGISTAFGGQRHCAPQMLYSRLLSGGRLMWSRIAVAVCLLACLFASASPEKKEPDAVSFEANTVESPYFKFRYSLPQGWLKLDDTVRMEQNRKKHQNAGGRIVNWTYDLLLASPGPIAEDGKLSLPYIHILAIENAQDLFGNGNYAKSFAKMKSLTVLHGPQQKKFSGQQFTRTDLADKESHYEALFDTAVRNYFLLFEFHGRTQEEMETLAKTMESLQFNK